MKTVVIIGGGNIGSRHLQASARLDYSVNIFVVEPSVNAKRVAIERFHEIQNSGIHDLNFCDSISELPLKVDVAIVATSSAIRRSIVEELLEHSKVEFLILEKFMFPKKEDFYAIGSLLKENNVKAYADCPRRAFSCYKELKRMLLNAKNIDMSVVGGDWGLACNGIHMFDLYAYLTETIEYSYDNELLDRRIYNSKREGYIEFGGRLSFKCNRGTIALTSYYGEKMPLSIIIQSDLSNINIYESDKLIVVENIDMGSLKTYCKPMDLLPTSEIITIVLKQLMDKGTCELPTYEENAAIELVMLDAFISKLNEISGKVNYVCMIT